MGRSCIPATRMQRWFLVSVQRGVALQVLVWVSLAATTVAAGDEPAPVIPADASPKLKELMERMLSNDMRDREMAVDELERETRTRRDEVQSVPFLIHLLLADHGSQGYFRAFHALLRIGEPAVLPLLDHLSRCKERGHRVAIVSLLRWINDRRAVEPTIRLLADADPWIRSQAARLVAAMPDTRALEPLLELCHDQNSNVRGPVADALGEICDLRAVDPLMAMLKADSDNGVRTNAARALGQLGDVRAVERLIAILDDSALADQVSLRRSAIAALGDLRDPRATDILMRIMMRKDRFYLESEQAAWALGRLKDVRVADRLAAAWQDAKQPREFRVLAAGALGETCHHQAVEALAYVMENGWQGPRLAAIRLLSEKGDRMSDRLLKAALEDRCDAVRMAAEIEMKKRALADKLKSQEKD
jgi:HEAT repeat protein